METDPKVSGRYITIQDIRSAAKRGEIAKKLGITPYEMKNLSAKELKNILQNIGEHDFSPDSEFDAEQLKMGIEIEKEHTQSPLIAKLIAKDHLKEDPKYYTKLRKMEGKKHD